MTTDSSRTTHAPKGVRPDIQALRAFAVMAVILYHLWPQNIRGGYVGVDMFFVISGFLITGQLLRESRETGSIRLGQFWARRARRLLPASLLVIGASLAATVLLIPEYFWKQFFSEFVASTLYFQNWRLNWDAVDYLARDNVASPVEHFWSLSVEEQFYFVWPLLVLLGWRALGAAPERRRKLFTALVLGVVTAASLAFCIVETSTNPSGAYFATTTRAWEFGVGSLLACLPEKWFTAPRKLRSIVVWTGLVLLGFSVFVFTDAMPFPGYIAVVPVAGTAAVIWARSVGTSPAGRLLGAEPLQFLGNNSYSAYLWHWPLIVITPFAVGEPLGWEWGVVLLVASFALAVVTRILVEDPIRNNKRLHQSRPAWTYAWSAAALSVIVATTGVVAANAFPTDHGKTDVVATALAKGCLGAGPSLSEVEDCDDLAIDSLILPRSAELDADNGNAFDCWTDRNQELESCSFGPADGSPFRVALVGDSHAAMLLPGLLPQLDSVGWRLDTFVGWGCQWTVSAENQCEGARGAIQSRLMDGDYDLVITTASRMSYAGQPYEQAVQDYVTAWTPVKNSGTRVIVIADNPLPSTEARECLILAGDVYDKAQECTTQRSTAESLQDHLIDASDVAGVPLIRFDEVYCQEDVCPMVSHHVVIYRDNSHITATFSKTLGPAIVDKVQAILSRG